MLPRPLPGGEENRQRSARSTVEVRGRYNAIMKKDELWPSEKVRKRAQELRRNPTPVEKRLWEHLLDRKLGGFKFRRQHPIGRFIADFYCHNAKLVVELDGELHARQVGYDTSRSSWFEERGVRVIRFQNIEVESEIEKVIAEILMACEQRT